MKPILWRIGVGVLLIVLGAVGLLQTLKIVNLEGGFWLFFISGLFILAGLAFLAVLVQDRSNWWAAIPGMTLLSIGALISLSDLAPGFSPYGGSLVLGGIGLSFWLVYLLGHQNWWAIIPGGVMVTLALVAGMDEVTGFDTGGIFFLGLGITFGLLAILPTGGHKMSWPWIPAGILLVMGVLLSLSEAKYANFVWPVVLILVGLVFLGRSMLRKSG
jgi:hypothetical protein